MSGLVQVKGVSRAVGIMVKIEGSKTRKLSKKPAKIGVQFTHFAEIGVIG